MVLQRIQQLQFTDRPAAEHLLLNFVRASFGLEAERVELRPLAVSLNSFNGFLTLRGGKRLFFKTHTEADNVIGEYYHAATLAQAGYPVIQPVFSSTEAGKQFLIYEVIEHPSVFDVSWEIETGRDDTLAALSTAQHAADDALLEIYLQTLALQTAEQAAEAPVHQLFYHRLAGGRLERFYGPLPDQDAPNETHIRLPIGEIALRDVRRWRWVINGMEYDESLDDIIRRAMKLLAPAVTGPSIIGHGDAHNGNLFFVHEGSAAQLLYFDPAFAGQHHPLLDLTKPLFHNVFAMWMYFPHEKAAITCIDARLSDDRLIVEHDYKLHPVREMFLESKVSRVLIPILARLKSRGELREDWRAYLKAALFCCPLLTMNLADADKFPPSVALLGLAQAVEMGSESRGTRSQIDHILDRVEAALNQG